MSKYDTGVLAPHGDAGIDCTDDSDPFADSDIVPITEAEYGAIKQRERARMELARPQWHVEAKS